jgi:glycosidase
VVKLIRDVAEAVNNRVVILTETNVPNKENLSYFGNNDEAHMVYQFSLPPLLLHALHTGNSRYITNWAKKIPVFSSNRTYFNFTASHDGIGVRPLEGLLPENEVKELLENMVKQGGMISTKRNSDGSNSPYEINITYFDALKGTNKGTDKLQTERFICSQTIMMSLQGIPAFYIHSLTATSNYSEGVKQTGRARTINRMKWQENELLKKLSGNQHNAEVFKELTRRIKIRQQYAAFHPSCPQEIIDSGNGFFVISRKTENEKLLVIANIKAENQIFSVSGNNNYEMDLLTNTKIPGNQLQFFPYQVMWLYSGT